MNGTLIVSIKNCARCAEDHPDMTFHRLHRPMVVDFELDGLEGRRTYQYWAMCPKQQEPILMEVSSTA